MQVGCAIYYLPPGRSRSDVSTPLRTGCRNHDDLSSGHTLQRNAILQSRVFLTEAAAELHIAVVRKYGQRGLFLLSSMGPPLTVVMWGTADVEIKDPSPLPPHPLVGAQDYDLTMVSSF